MSKNAVEGLAILLIILTGIPVLPLATMYIVRLVRHFLALSFQPGRTLTEALKDDSRNKCDVLAIVVGHIWPIALTAWLFSLVVTKK